MASDDGDKLRQAVFGANDGLVSTFGLLAGLVGAAVPQTILILASVVNMFAAGMSMGLGSYLASKSELEFHRKLRAEEEYKIQHQRTKAEAELLFYLRQKGVPMKAMKEHMRQIMRTEDEWLNFICEEKHGLAQASFPNPVKGAAIMFGVFIGCGLIPILPLFFSEGHTALGLSALFTGTALFFVGALKHKLTGRSWFALGMENLLIGAITGTVGFVAGAYTAHLIG